MRILVHDHAGHPFQVQLSRELAQRGHRVLHMFRGDEITPHGAMTKQECDLDSFELRPLTTKSPLKKYSFVKRWFQEREYGGIYARHIADFQPDVVFSANTPLESQLRGLRYCQSQGIKYVHWWTDFTGYTARAILTEKYGLVGHLPSQYFIALEKRIVRGSDHVIVTTEDHYAQCDQWGVERDRVSVVHNWAPLEEYPTRPRDNDWAKAHGTIGKFCFMWTGTLGFKHSPELLLELALKYRDRDDVKVLVVSSSIGAKWLQEKKQELSLANLELLGFQAYEDVPDMMAAADVLVASVNNEVSFYAVPSKALSYLCSARPVLLAIDEGNLAARILRKHQTGLVVNPKDRSGFLAAADRLLSDTAASRQMGLNGREYAESHFNILSITDKFEDIIRKLGLVLPPSREQLPSPPAVSQPQPSYR